MFDRVLIITKAGKGGDGGLSFRREKFVPLGGPDGGDGGCGGDVLIRADAGVSSLVKFRQKKVYRAEDGKNGREQKKHGKSGKPMLLTVPVGTVVIDESEIADSRLVADLNQPGQEVVVAVGGRGGWGNTHFASPTNQAPRLVQKGEPGEEKSVLLELKIIADVGVVGYPNAGKSTLLKAASAAKPKIASYPFTTLEPVLGVVEFDRVSFVLAEIPGLIRDAHLGRGLGHDFLRHVIRTRMLVHLIDGSSTSPVDDMIQVNRELDLFDSALAQKPQLVAVNKIDLPEVQAGLESIREAFSRAGITPVFISAASGEGVSRLMEQTLEMLGQVIAEEKTRARAAPKVFRPKPKEPGISVHKEGDIFVVRAPDIERIVAGMDRDDSEVRRQLQGQLDRVGVNRALRRAKVKPGDKVRLGQLEWRW